MTTLLGLKCHLCGAKYPAEALWVCRECLGPLEVERGGVSHPVVRPPARVLPALEPLAVAADPHRHDPDPLRLPPRVRRQG